MKKTFIFVLTAALLITTGLFSFSANTLPIDEVEKELDTRRNDVDAFMDYVYMLPAEQDAPNVSVGYGDSKTYRITTEEYRDWNAFVKKAESIFAENMLYKALYNDWVRGEDGILYRITPDGDLAFVSDRVERKIGYIRTFEFTENVYGRYIQYDHAAGYSVYRVEMWKYDEQSNEFYLLDTNDTGFFTRSNIWDTRPEYKIEDYYLDYKGGFMEVDEFENYCTAVYNISRLMSENKNILGYDLSDENVSINVTYTDKNTVKANVTLPVYDESNNLTGTKTALVIIDKDLIANEYTKGLDVYDADLGYHIYSGIIYEEISGKDYTEIPDTADSSPHYLILAVIPLLICAAWVIRKKTLVK